MLKRVTLVLALVALAFVPASPAAPFGELAGSIDAELLRINREIPGFGGVFHDAEGIAHVYLTDPGQAGLLERLGVGELRVVQGRYEFSQLYAWRAELRGLLTRADVAYLDIDETRNRIRIGVVPGRALATRSLSRELVRLGVPQEAVEVVEAAPIVELSHNAQDAFNPIPGGVEINFPGFLCTLGFNVRFSNAGDCYFLTNDHCSATSGVTDGTLYFQPFGGPNIAVERFDPPFFTGGACPAGFQCKFSDSTAAVYFNPADCEFARIVRTFVNSIVVDPANPRWFIVGKNYAPGFNQRHLKQGRTTGLTIGPLTGTCVDVQASGTNHVRLCQNLVGNAGGPVVVAGGDSGSPVFTLAPGSNLKVELVGILWGGTVAGDIYVYSPMTNIETDFGFPLPVGP